MKSALIILPLGGLCLAGAAALDTSFLAQQSTPAAAVAPQSAPAGAAGLPGRDERPAPVRSENAPAVPESDDPQFGRPNPGRPAYQDPELPAPKAAPAAAEASDQKPSATAAAADSPAAPLTLADGFFFDNVTLGTGFGVYGGDAVTSGQQQQLGLTSAGLTARNLGLPVGPTEASSSASPR